MRRKSGKSGRRVARSLRAARASVEPGLRLTHRVLSSAIVRRMRVDEKEILVAPLVILTRTVIDCATCPVPELEIPEEFAKEPSSWNGHPVTYDHPTVARAGGGRNFISAHDPKAAPFKIGEIHNARRDGDRLCAEAWIDVAKVEERGFGELISRLEEGEEIELSPGFYADSEAKEGDLGGVHYASIGRNVTPDHVALLPPTERAACSWDQGCGVRAASESDEGKGPHCYKCAADALARDLIAGQVSDADLRQSLELALWDSHEDSEFLYVVAVFEDRCVYYVDGNQVSRSFTKDESGSVTFTSEPERVRSVTDYIAASQRKESPMNREQTIANLVAAKKLEGDKAKNFRAMCAKLDDEGLKALADSEPAPEAEAEKKAREEKAAADLKAKADADAKAKVEADAKAKNEPTPEARAAALRLLGLTPETIEFVVGQAEEQKKQAIATIRAASEDWTEEELRALDIKVLAKMASTMAPKSTGNEGFVGRGGPRGGGSDPSSDPLAEGLKGMGKRVAELRGSRVQH